MKRGWFYYQPPTQKGFGSLRPKAVALRTRNLIDALTRMEEDRVAFGAVQSAKSGTLEEFLPHYYHAKREDRPATRRVRKVVLSAFRDDLENPRVIDLTPQMIDDWRTRLMQRTGRTGKPLSGATIKTYTITVKAFINWLREEKIIRHNPMARMKRQTRVAKTRRHQFYSEEEREKVLAVDAPDYLKLILHLGFFAGLRDGEMLAMTPDWVWLAEDGARGTITVKETPINFTDGTSGVWRPKTLEMRTIPLHSRLLEFLKAYGMRREADFFPLKR